MKKYLVTTEIIVKENKIGILRDGNVDYISPTEETLKEASEKFETVKPEIINEIIKFKN